jgi:uncharacterized phage infection (PIP) family protein YhgE
MTMKQALSPVPHYMVALVFFIVITPCYSSAWFANIASNYSGFQAIAAKVQSAGKTIVKVTSDPYALAALGTIATLYHFGPSGGITGGLNTLVIGAAATYVASVILSTEEQLNRMENDLKTIQTTTTASAKLLEIVQSDFQEAKQTLKTVSEQQTRLNTGLQTVTANLKQAETTLKDLLEQNRLELLAAIEKNDTKTREQLKKSEDNIKQQLEGLNLVIQSLSKQQAQAAESSQAGINALLGHFGLPTITTVPTATMPITAPSTPASQIPPEPQRSGTPASSSTKTFEVFTTQTPLSGRKGSIGGMISSAAQSSAITNPKKIVDVD